MKPLLIALLGAFAVSAASQADITVDTAWITQYEITPTDSMGSYTRTYQKGLKLPYDECVTEMLKAQAAMEVREIAAARSFNLPIHTDFAGGAADADPDGYKPMSIAECLRERWTIKIRVTGASRQPIQCPRVWVEGFSWPDQYASADTCP